VTRSQALVSVAIPVYNGGEYLRPAVESVLAQTHANLEIWVIDDGSTDGCIDTLSDLRDSRLRIVHQAQSGKSVALNRFLDGRSGAYYAIQDADDLSHPRRIEAQLAFLEAHPDLGACFTGHELILDGRHCAPRFRAKGVVECARDIERLAMPAHDPTAMFRLSMVGDVRYDARLPIAQGYDYTLRVGEQFPLAVLGECLYSYRIHSQSVTHRDPARRRAQVQEVARRAFERRKQPIPVDADPPLRRSSRNRHIDNNLVAHLIESTLDQRRAGHRSGMLATALLGPRLHPFDWEYYKPLACALAPHAALRRLRGRSA
jgi:glycosyltransferase involved in cell wall biosynthesis